MFERGHVSKRDARRERIERMIVRLSGENGDLIRRLHIAERELHREPIHLRFRQRIRASKFHGVLRGDDEEQIGEIAPFAVHAHLAFTHRFEQSGLRAWGSAVDFVREQNVGEDRPFVKMELLIKLVEDRDAKDIRGQQVWRELNALELGIHGACERFGERGLTCAGKIFQ